MAGRHALTRNLAIEFARQNMRERRGLAVVETPIYGTFMTLSKLDPALLMRSIRWDAMGNSAGCSRSNCVRRVTERVGSPGAAC